MDLELTTFVAFAISSQLILLAFFAARRWQPQLAERYGWVAYGFGLLGLAIGIGLAAVGAPWQLFVGPILFAVWAAYGAWVDLFRRIEWRPMAGPKRPIQWNFVGPYITLYLAAQMFLWWPMWDYWQPGWFVYLVLFVANTGLNIAGHFGSAGRSAARTA